jgi:uncharacterized membrane protein
MLAQLALSLLAVPVAQGAPPRYRCVVLEPLTHDISTANAINEGGECVGTVMQPTGGWLGSTAARWDDSGALTVLGRAGTGDGSTANDINADGVVVGGSSWPIQIPLIWTQPDGGMPIQYLYGSQAVAINDVGDLLIEIGPPYAGALLLERSGSFVSISSLATGAWDFRGLSDDRRFTGWRMIGSSSVTYRWSESGGFEDLALPTGFTNSSGWNIAAHGAVAGEAWNDVEHHAVVWDAAGLPRVLPQPAVVTSFARAEAVNRNGLVVGWCLEGSAAQDAEFARGYAVVWSNGSAYLLEDLIVEGPHLEVHFAADVNDAGQIVGSAPAAADGYGRAVRLDPL